MRISGPTTYTVKPGSIDPVSKDQSQVASRPRNFGLTEFPGPGVGVRTRALLDSLPTVTPQSIATLATALALKLSEMHGPQSRKTP
jgi:hypothetical protein